MEEKGCLWRLGCACGICGMYCDGKVQIEWDCWKYLPQEQLCIRERVWVSISASAGLVASKGWLPAQLFLHVIPFGISQFCCPASAVAVIPLLIHLHIWLDMFSLKLPK